MRPVILRTLAIAAGAFFSGCATTPLSEQIRGHAPGPSIQSGADAVGDATEEPKKLGAEVSPKLQVQALEVPGVSPPPPAKSRDRATPQPRLGSPTPVSFENAPIPAFINAVFAETLKFTLRMDPQVAAKAETITLRTGDPVSAKDLFDIASAALRDYDVVIVVESPHTLRFTTADAQRGGAPQVYRGGSLGRSAFTGDGRIYYLYQIRAASSDSLFTVVNNAFGGKIQLTSSPSDNALLLSGPPDLLEAALDVLQAFDQPRMAGKPAVTIEPVFLTPTKMSDALSKILRTAGYGVSTTPDAAPINLVPLDEVGALIVFASDAKLRQFALDWAKQIDEPRQGGAESEAFIYFVKNTDVDSVARVLGAALASSGGAAGQKSAISLQGDARLPSPGQNPAPSAQAPGGPLSGGLSGSQVTEAAGLRVATDPARNALIFVGKSAQYSSILPLLRQLDRSPGEVLIEVVLAEITLTDNTSLGVEWDLGNKLNVDNSAITAVTQGLGVGSTGLLVRALNASNGVRATINALARRNRVNIISNPRVVAKSGVDANIQVGTQVPVLRQTSSNVQFGQTGITNSVDYIDTGVVLKVRPVIRGDRRVSLDVSQEVSEAQQNDTSSIGSPLIFTRSIATSLSLEDGQTVLLGGLKSQNRSNTRAGVPLLSKLPGLGAAFRNEAAARTDTELLVFITPYVVSDPTVANSVVERYRSTMQRWRVVSGGLEW